MAKDATTVANLWASRLSASTPEITAGVNAVTQAPGARAAANVQGWIAGIQAAQDKWVRNVSAVTLSQWQSAMINKGVPRVSSGAQAAIPKMTQFMTQWLPHAESVAQQVRSMPKGTIDQGIARVTAQIRGNAQFVRKPYTL